MANRDASATAPMQQVAETPAANRVAPFAPRPRSLVRELIGNPRVWIPGVALLALAVVAVFAPLLTPSDPFAMNTPVALQGPTDAHPLGTDEYGRDLLSRLIRGSRSSLLVAITSVSIACAAGLLIGVTGAYFGGWWEIISMRAVDVLLTFPPILLAITVVAFLGPSVPNLIGVIALLYAPRFARLSYGSTLQVKQREYIQAAQVIGATAPRILVTGVVPNILAPIFVQISLSLGFAILLESGLSFLGLGTPPPEPSWGNMVGVGRGYMRQSGWYVFWPSMAISLAILACNTLGDGLRDALDPRLRR